MIYDTASLSTGRTFRTSLITARQPRMAAKSHRDEVFSTADAEQPLGNICFSCICSFKKPDIAFTSYHQPSPQERFTSILNSRSPLSWPLSPSLDIKAVTDAFPDSGGASFPMVEMRKVDMTEHNSSLPIPERRELLLYRLLAPLSADEPNSHVLVHAFVGDRNSLLVVGNYVGFGHKFGMAASLSYAFFVHTNVDQAVMKFGQAETKGWWIQEASWPRFDAGRAMLVTKHWSPEGLHVATGFQDGLLRPSGKTAMKL
jgi:hypothetical protein